MKDVVFNDNDQLIGKDESTRHHQRDILIHHPGWNKFTPQLAFGIDQFIDDEMSAEELKTSIMSNFQRDGQRFNEINISETGEIQIDAQYNS